MSSNTRRPIPKRIRFAVLTKNNFTCQYCGRAAPEVKLHTDHYIPVSAGGPDEFWNFIASCQDCNLGKKDGLIHRLYIKDWNFKAIGIGFISHQLAVKMSVTSINTGGFSEELNQAYSKYGEVPIRFAYERTKGKILTPGKEYIFTWPFTSLSNDLDFEAPWMVLDEEDCDLELNAFEIFSLILEKASNFQKMKTGDSRLISSPEFLGQGILNLLSPGPLSVLCWDDNSEG